ncbi:MAG TPA: DUF928 domain-containing protein [Coleofasciculaceae cyanobacterium]
MKTKGSTHWPTLLLSASVVLAMGVNLPVQGYSSPQRTAQTVERGADILLARRRIRIIKFSGIGTSSNRTAGASRSDSCVEQNQTATALIPENTIGLTVAASPTLLFNVPQTSAKSAEFGVREKEAQGRYKTIYKTTVPLPGTAGIVSVSLPANGSAASQLQVDKTYQWFFRIVCSADEDDLNVYLDGSIQRVAESPALTNALKSASPQERPAIYAEEGVWFDAIADLAQLRRQNPNDSTLAEDWAALLQAVGLDAMVEAPLVGSTSGVR